MKKKVIALLVLAASVLTLTACGKQEKDVKKEKDAKAAVAFKEDYESINDQVGKSGKKNRTLNIPKDNMFEQITAKEALEKIEKGETFYIYFGDKLCPWCRSVIEKSIEVAKKNKVDKIYYVAIWDKDGNEILRDKYELVEKKTKKDKKSKKTETTYTTKKVSDGAEEYSKLLEKLDNVLSDYTLTTSKDKKVKVGEKRIYAPNSVYIKDGKAVKLTEGISEKQTDAFGELTEEILKDEEKLFNDFFKN